MVEMISVTVAAGDYSRMVYVFEFTERREWRLYREFNGCRALIPAIAALESVTSVGFGSSENGFSLTVGLDPGRRLNDRKAFDLLVETTIDEVTEALMRQHFGEMAHAL